MPVPDIFAVGVLLHELLAAAPAFRGATAVEVMTATLKEDPPELPATVPDGIRHIVRRCLEKNPEERFQSARDLAFALRQLTGSGVTAIDQAAGSSEPVRAVRRTVLWGASIAAAGFAVGVLLAGLAVARSAAVQDATLDPIQLTRVAADPRNEISPAISPDGRLVAYLRVGGIQTELLVKPFESLAPVLLAVSNAALSSPVWSPDGNQVCYTDLGRNLLCVGAAGGSPRRVLQNVYRPRLAPDGTVFFTRVFEKEPWLFRGDLRGSEPQRVGASALPVDLTAVSAVSPDGAALVAAAASGRWRISLPDGARLALPSEEGMRVLSITWLPDSRHIATVEETTKLIGSRLVVQDTRSTARRVILHTPDYIESMAVSGDGARIRVLRRTSGA